MDVQGESEGRTQRPSGRSTPRARRGSSRGSGGGDPLAGSRARMRREQAVAPGSEEALGVEGALATLTQRPLRLPVLVGRTGSGAATARDLEACACESSGWH